MTCRPAPKPNNHCFRANVSSLPSENHGNNDPESDPRTKLDSHANMVVIGKNAHILGSSGRTASVSPFTTAYNALEDIPIFDAAIAYDCLYIGQTYILVCCNALHITSIVHNLIPPSIMREANIVVSEVPKIQTKNPDASDHSIWFPEVNFRIQLSLRGIFSYFLSRKPTIEELRTSDNILMLTPEGHSWNPHSDSYARNEENMLDWEGNMVERRHRPRIIVDDLPEPDDAIVASFTISSVETGMIDQCFQQVEECITDESTCDNNYAVLAGVSLIYDPVRLYDLMLERRDAGVFAASIGSTTVGHVGSYLIEDENVSLLDSDTLLSDDDLMSDTFAVGATTASKPQGVSAKHLSKVWRIDFKTAENTLDVTTQLLRQYEDPTLSQNYSTNDQML